MKYLLPIFLCLFTFPSFSQTQSGSFTALSWHPLSLNFNALEVGVEKNIGNPQNSIKVYGLAYLGNTNRYESQRNHSSDQQDFEESYLKDRVGGWGARIEYRHYFFNRLENASIKPFFGLSGSYHQVQLKYADYGWTPIEIDGVSFFNYTLNDFQEDISRTDINLSIGLRKEFIKKLVLDIYGGGVYKITDISTTNSQSRNYNNSLLDFGYSGLGYHFGFSAGWLFTK